VGPPDLPDSGMVRDLRAGAGPTTGLGSSKDVAARALETPSTGGMGAGDDGESAKLLV